MQAAYIDQPGPPENIQYGELPTPKPQGAKCWSKSVPFPSIRSTPTSAPGRGHALAAAVCALAAIWPASWKGSGPRAAFKPGDRVWGSNQGLLGRQGTFAEYAAVDECWLYPTPPSVTDEQAAAQALVGITACLGLTARCEIESGRNGLLARRLRRNWLDGGANVAGDRGPRGHHAPAARKRSALPRAGGELVVNYRTEDVAARVKEFAPDGVNLFWESLHEPNFDAAIAMLARAGE